MDAEAVAAQIVASRVSRRKGKLDRDEAMQIAEFYWLVVEGEAAGWDHRQIGALIEASVSELFDLTPEGVETGRSSARR